MTTIKCDKCNQESMISFRLNQSKVTISAITSMKYFDLCNDCNEMFQNWMSTIVHKETKVK